MQVVFFREQSLSWSLVCRCLPGSVLIIDTWEGEARRRTGHREKMSCNAGIWQPHLIKQESLEKVFLQSHPGFGQNCPLQSLNGYKPPRISAAGTFLKWLMATGYPLRSLAESGACVFKVTWATCFHVLHILPLIQMFNSYRYA